MSEEIVITTESVKVEDLSGREKRIYDYAYKKGMDDAVTNRNREYVRFILVIILTALFLFFF